MFAIQTGSKFVQAKFFLVDTKLFDMVVSTNPKKYKNRDAAAKDMALAIKFVKSELAEARANLVNFEQNLNKNTNLVSKLENKLAATVDPRKLEKLGLQLWNARHAVDMEHSKRYKLAIKRFEQILKQGFRVVKLQQIVSAA